MCSTIHLPIDALRDVTLTSQIDFEPMHLVGLDEQKLRREQKCYPRQCSKTRVGLPSEWVSSIDGVFFMHYLNYLGKKSSPIQKGYY
mmetsp:Transcript_6727/g.14674  ORF Transcript_6727/g.14674 Transcript_6727/m.14674 type:complete len:87 (-) Transcript_6727:197-457(-)